MSSICGTDCCQHCPELTDCGGCEKTQGHPCGGECLAAKYIKTGGMELFNENKAKVLAEINALHIPGLSISDLNLLRGNFVNVEFRLTNGQKMKLLQDEKIYWGNQIEIGDGKQCYGIAADEHCIMVCRYGCNCANAKLVLFKER